MTSRRSSNLAAIRKSRGLTQDELAEKAGLTVRTIQRIESGQVHPQIYTLRTLASCLDTTIEELFPGGEPAAENPGGYTSETSQEKQVNRGLLAAMHILPLVGIYAPLLNILIPLVFWLLKKDEHQDYNRQGIMILNFQITITILTGSSIALLVLFFPVGYPLMLACYALAIISGGWNMIRVLKGHDAKYPLSIRFIALAAH